MGKGCANHLHYNCCFQFYIEIDYELSQIYSKDPNKLQAGDVITLINRKYHDLDGREFIGDTYTSIEVIAVVGDVQKCITTRRLEFDGEGTVITDGVVDLKITIDQNKLKTLVILRNDIAVVGGTGKFIGAQGIYLTRNIRPNYFLGELKLKV